MGGDLISLNCIADNDYVVQGIMNPKKAIIEIVTGENPNQEQQKRPPLNICLVLDRSGSMQANHKLDFAKKAVVSVLNTLEDQDMVHLVVYDDKVDVVFAHQYARDRSLLQVKVNAIHSGNTTNLSGGMEKGASLLETDSPAGYAKRMFVFSDGLLNVGIQSKEGIRDLVTTIYEKDIKIDSFGIGADFDEGIMKTISECGGSEFFFLKSADVIEELVIKALQGVFDLCALAATLTIRGCNGAIVTKVWGYDDVVNGAKLGGLHYKNTRQVICEFTVPGSMNDIVEVLEYELSYTTNEKESTIKDHLSMKFTTDATLTKAKNTKVEVFHSIQETSSIDEEIASLIKRSQTKEAIALQEKQIIRLKQVLKLDETNGVVKDLLDMAEEALKKLQREGSSAESAQHYSHQCYMKQRGSLHYYVQYSPNGTS
eukprot:TRINITY_DN1998_c0_g1_i1.p1 TRINITY_DN1998_c0_g1~~TRINITY_DN1998_c0_g1_i1.p1  ORF type:complete len:459 (-),score=136.42 TRINITY_DN1998_c0_g1_i1:117-1400(-)